MGRLIIAVADNSSLSLGFNLASLLPTTDFSGTPWYAEMLRMANSFKAFTDPRGIYAYCFCENIR